MSQAKNVKRYTKTSAPADEVKYTKTCHKPKKMPITNNGK